VTAAAAVRQLAFDEPVADLSPPRHCNGRYNCPDTYVGIPTWLWVGNPGNISQSATASNGVDTGTVVATAHIISTEWDLGDPRDSASDVRCTGPGMPYDAARYPAKASSPDCGYRFVHSSAAQSGLSFKAQVSVAYEIIWVGYGYYAGRSGNSGVKVITGQRFGLPVGELQAVNTAG